MVRDGRIGNGDVLVAEVLSDRALAIAGSPDASAIGEIGRATISSGVSRCGRIAAGSIHPPRTLVASCTRNTIWYENWSPSTCQT